jgi:hypothetical protein
MTAMLLSENPGLAALGARMLAAKAVTPELVAEIIDLACRHLPSLGQPDKPSRIERLIDARAWTDMALAMIDAELPLWRIRRIAYDAGEWHCALSRQCGLPDWLDEAIECRHADLTLALLCAFVEAEAAVAASSRPSVPSARITRGPLYDPLCSDNFA